MPQAFISLKMDYGAKAYFALLPSFYELHASLLVKYTLLEISSVSCIVCLPGRSVLPDTWFTSAYLSYRFSPCRQGTWGCRASPTKIPCEQDTAGLPSARRCHFDM
jgi:hypothetical protein